MSSNPVAAADGPDEELELSLPWPCWRVADGDDDDDDDVVMHLQPVDVRAIKRQACANAPQRTVLSRAKGGWRYSIGRLLQATLYAHYLRCASSFCRSVIFAVSFALGSEDWLEFGDRR